MFIVFVVLTVACFLLNCIWGAIDLFLFDLKYDKITTRVFTVCVLCLVFCIIVFYVH